MKGEMISNRLLNKQIFVSNNSQYFLIDNSIFIKVDNRDLFYESIFEIETWILDNKTYDEKIEMNVYINDFQLNNLMKVELEDKCNAWTKILKIYKELDW